MRASSSASALVGFTLLIYATRTAYAFFFPPIIPLLWSGCKLGWFIIPFVVCQNKGGVASQTAPPLVCGADQYIWNGACQPRTSLCSTAPNTLVVASASSPCRCVAPGYTPAAGQTACNNPANGIAYCETNGAGTSSTCKIKCSSGYQEGGGNCLKSELANCPPGQSVGTGRPGAGCVCLTTGSPATAVAQVCPDILPDTDGLYHGDIVCRPDATTGTGTCVPKCDPGFVPIGNAGCTAQV